MANNRKLMKKEIAVLVALRKFSNELDTARRMFSEVKQSEDFEEIVNLVSRLRKRFRSLLSEWMGWLGVERAERMASKQLNKYLKSVNENLDDNDLKEDDELSEDLEKIKTYNDHLITNLARGGRVEEELEAVINDFERFKPVGPGGQVNRSGINQLVKRFFAIQKKVNFSKQEIKALEALIEGLPDLVLRISAAHVKKNPD